MNMRRRKPGDFNPPEKHDFLIPGLHIRIFGVNIAYAVIADARGYLPSAPEHDTFEPVGQVATVGSYLTEPGM